MLEAQPIGALADGGAQSWSPGAKGFRGVQAWDSPLPLQPTKESLAWSKLCATVAENSKINRAAPRADRSHRIQAPFRDSFILIDSSKKPPFIVIMSGHESCGPLPRASTRTRSLNCRALSTFRFDLRTAVLRSYLGLVLPSASLPISTLLGLPRLPFHPASIQLRDAAVPPPLRPCLAPHKRQRTA